MSMGDELLAIGFPPKSDPPTLSPQHATPPVALNAHVKYHPDATATAFVMPLTTTGDAITPGVGLPVSPYVSKPQQSTLPDALAAHV
jgi:hypothetical protein